MTARWNADMIRYCAYIQPLTPVEITLIKMRRDGVTLRNGALPYESEMRGYLTINDTQSNRLHRQAKTARLFSDPEGTRNL